NTRCRQRLNRCQSARRLWSTRFQFAREIGIQRSHRNKDQNPVDSREFAKQINIASDEFILRDDNHWIPEFNEHLQTSTCQPETSLNWLVCVRDPADCDHLRLPSWRCEFVAQQLRRVLLDEDLRLEIKSRGEAEVLVVRTSETIDAAVLTPTVGINARVESNIRAVVVIDDAARVVIQERRLNGGVFRLVP